MKYILGLKFLSSYWCCNCFIKAISFYNGVHIVLFPSLLRYQLNTMVVDTEAGPHRNRTVVFLGSTRGTVLKFLITPSPENLYSNTNTFLEELEGYNPERWKDCVFETSLRQDHCISDTGQFWEFGVFCVFFLSSGKKTFKIYISMFILLHFINLHVSIFITIHI